MSHADSADLVELIAEVLRDRYPAPPGTTTVGFRADGRAIVEKIQSRLDVVDSWRLTARVMLTRPDWDDYFLAIAKAVATRADCRRAQHGAVVVDAHHRIISTGYNGTPPRRPPLVHQWRLPPRAQDRRGGSALNWRLRGLPSSTRRTELHRQCHSGHARRHHLHHRQALPDVRQALLGSGAHRWCGAPFQVLTRGDNNRRYCRKECAKKASSKTVSDWRKDHPGHMKQYNINRVAKNPGVWVEKSRQNRLTILALLGGRCTVRGCGVDNPVWLHVDYIPTSRGERHRHPRHIAYVRANKVKFRLLCANHHYELTLTGRIKGTRIRQ